jgi:hypothetical protein
LSAEGEPVHGGQHDIQQHQVERCFTGDLQPLAAVSNATGVVSIEHEDIEQTV